MHIKYFIKRLIKDLFSKSSKLPNNSYVLTLSGGIGNQLLQYSIGEYARRELKKNIYYLDITKSYRNKHSSEIESLLNIQINKISFSNIFKIPLCFLFLPKSLRLQTFIYKKFGIKLPNLYFEDNFTDIEIFQKDSKFYPNLYIGTWHNLITKYNFTKIIRTYEFNTNFQIPELLKDLFNKQVIGLHVRRGDYIKDKRTSNFHGNLTNKYFLDSVKYLRNIYGELPVFIFSDDIEWVKYNLRPLINNSFIFEKSRSAEMDLYLMSKCSYFVLSNSTFSWWAACLSSSVDKFIVVPRYWFKGVEVNKSIIPLDWNYEIL